jgi:Protein of unknown function (DUF2852)
LPAGSAYVNVRYIRILKEDIMSCGYRAAFAADGTTYGEDRPRLFRSGWEIAAMVGGFIVFFPLGLGILGYLFWRKKMAQGDFGPGGLKGEYKRWKTGVKEQWRGRAGGIGGFHRGSGNLAFDDYRVAVLQRLEEERRRLDDEQRAFNDFVLRLRRAKDQEEFDRFMAERNGGAPAAA